MNNPQTTGNRQALVWLSEEVTIRLARKWLVIGAVAMVVLLVLAFD